MDKKEVLKLLKKIEIKTKVLSKHILSGEYHSAFKGRGMSFSEVRGYQYGDDVRNIDWNVTARSNDTHVKVFEEEREMTLMLLIDLSASTFFGSKLKSKRELIVELAALLGFSAMSNNDKVGAILFTDKVEKYISPKKGRKNIMRIIMTMLTHEVSSKATDIQVALKYLAHVQKKKSIVFVVSDFLDQNFSEGLSIASSKHDIIGLHVYDNVERDMPNLGLVKLYDPEKGKSRWINTLMKSNRISIKESFDRQKSRIKDEFKKTGSGFISISSDDDYVKSLVKFFKSR